MSRNLFFCSMLFFTVSIFQFALADEDEKHHHEKSEGPHKEHRAHMPVQGQGQPSPQLVEPPSTNSREQIKHLMRQRGLSGKVRISPREKGQIYSQDAVRRVGDRLKRTHPDRSTWFNDQFFSKHHLNPYYHRHGNDWWRRSQWVTINRWLPYGWSYPVDYSEGYPEEIPIEPYSYPQPEEVPQEQFGDWLPLGIFATGRTVDEAAVSNILIQLAINRNGDLAGTYYNVATNLSYLIEGVVDPETQQAAWKLANTTPAPLMVTGIYNLSQDVVSTVVYNPDGSAESWVLVRVMK